MGTNYDWLKVIHDFLWSGDYSNWKALTEWHCDPVNCRYSKKYLLECYRELLERIIEEWLHYKSAEQCIFNCSS